MLRSELPAPIQEISSEPPFLSVCVKRLAPSGKLEQMVGLIQSANETPAPGITDVLARLHIRIRCPKEVTNDCLRTD